jgi:hypothetical protein
MIDVQDVRLDLLAIASATDCPNRARSACEAVVQNAVRSERQLCGDQ